MDTEMWFWRKMFGSCSITVTDISITTQVTLISKYVIVFFLYVFWIKNGCTYVLLTSHWLMVCLYILFLVGFTNCVGNDQLEAEIHHQPYRSHCENGSYNYNLKARLTSLFCQWQQRVLNSNNTITAAELHFLNLPPTYSCPSVKECYSFMWCHCSFWILRKLQLILDNGCMNAPTDNGKQGLYISGQ